MLRSRMFTTAFRFFAGLAGFSLVAAIVVAFTSQTQTPVDRVIGPLSLGWKGGVGDHLAYAMFVGLFAMSAGLAGVLIAFRDADPEAEAQVVHAESVPLTRAPVGDNFLPAMSGFAVVLAMVGLATSEGVLIFAGLGLLVCVAFVWTLRNWAERATGDPTVNAELYHRFIDPLRTPIVAAVSIAVVVIGLSRLLLAVSKTGSVIIFGAIALVFFLVATLLALKPGSGRSVATVLVVIGAIAVIGAGIAGIVVGERDIEHHETDTTEGSTESSAPAPAPAVVVVEPAAQA